MKVTSIDEKNSHDSNSTLSFKPTLIIKQADWGGWQKGESKVSKMLVHNDIYMRIYIYIYIYIYIVEKVLVI